MVVALVLAAGGRAFAACPAPDVTNIVIHWSGEFSNCTPSDASCRAGEPIRFTPIAFGYSFDLCPHAFQWSFGDGTDPVAGQTVEHSFSAAGDYNVTLSVANESGSVVVIRLLHITSLVGQTGLPAIDLFTAVPSRIQRGEQVTLLWSARLTRSVRIDPLSAVYFSSSGEYRFQPDASQEYVLTAYGDAGLTSKTVVVEVVNPRRRAAGH